MRMGGDPVNLSNGLLNLTNWLGNVIMPTMAGYSPPQRFTDSARRTRTPTSGTRPWRL